MRNLLVVVFCFGGLLLSSAAFASKVDVAQDYHKQLEVKQDCPVVKAPVASKAAVDVLVRELSVSFVEFSESDAVQFLNAAPATALSDTVSRRCKPELNMVEPTCSGKPILQIL